MVDLGKLTYLARLTPPGKSAIASLGLIGPQAWKIVHQNLKLRGKKTLPTLPEPGDVFLGRLGDGFGDEVVVGCKNTNPMVIEIHPHGGTQVVLMLLNFLHSGGATLCTWNEFLTHLYSDPLKAMAAVLLNQANTVEPSKILLDQFNGAFRSWLDPFLNFVQTENFVEARKSLNEVNYFSFLSSRLVEPWQVVLAGPTNAGKSSLMNLLAGYQRSIVSDLAGTTRDVLLLETAIEGWPVSFADTAGIRSSSDVLENAGMRIGAEAIDQADLVLWVEDCSLVEAAIPQYVQEKKILTVKNKIDLLPSMTLSLGTDSIAISAMTGLGMDNLMARIIQIFIPEKPRPCAAVAFYPMLKLALEKSIELLDKGRIQDIPKLWESFQGHQK